MNATPLPWYFRIVGYLVLIALFRPAKWILFTRIDGAAKILTSIVFSLLFWASIPVAAIYFGMFVRHSR